MKQVVDVMAVYKKEKREPIPVKFRLFEDGKNLTVDIFDVLNFEYIGSNRIDFECNALSNKGRIIGLKEDNI